MEQNEDIDSINQAELVEEFGNMFLVEINGEIRKVAATSKNELLYRHGMYRLLHPDAEDERVILTDEEEDEFIAIAPTENDSVYQIWVGNSQYPIMNTPSRAKDVLKGVKEATESPKDYSQIKSVYNDIASNQVRRSVINHTRSIFPQTEVIPDKEGWNIMGLFILTWDSRVFLNTTKDIDDRKTYKVSGRSVKESENSKQFLRLSISDEIISEYKDTPVKLSYANHDMNIKESKRVNKECPSCNKTDIRKCKVENHNDEQPEKNYDSIFLCNNCDQGWREFKLTEREIEFMSKAKWLLNHREKLDDDAFWDVIESYVINYPSIVEN